MSDDRRKKQELEHRGSDPSKMRNAVVYAIVVILIAGAFATGRYYKNHKYDAFARCLAAKQAKMYGLYWCPHCADQKAMFGSSFRYVPYVECAIRGSRDLAPECKAAGVKLFPSWQFGTNPPKEGVVSLQSLSQQTGCSLP